MLFVGNGQCELQQFLGCILIGADWESQQLVSSSS
jgi:hypothetical protein